MKGLTILAGVVCTEINGFFRYFLGTDRLPETDADWVALCEVDLRHVTGGAVVVDGPGELTRRRAALAYYPDTVWKKRIADALAELGIAQKPARVPFDEGLTDLTLYHSAAQIYAGLPKDLLPLSFNRTEPWERLARDVLFDSNDYFLKRRHEPESQPRESKPHEPQAPETPSDWSWEPAFRA